MEVYIEVRWGEKCNSTRCWMRCYYAITSLETRMDVVQPWSDSRRAAIALAKDLNYTVVKKPRR